MGVVFIGGTFAYQTGVSATSLFSPKNPVLKIGLVGCGRTGTGAANQALSGDPNVVLYGVAEIFEDRINDSLSALEKIYGRSRLVKAGDLLALVLIRRL